MSSREAILARIRKAHGRSGAEPTEAELVQVRAHIAHHTAGPQPSLSRPADAVEQFRRECDRVGTTHGHAASLAELPREVGRYLDANGLERRVVGWREFAALDWSGAGIAYEHRTAEPADRTGLTGCFCAIAETGTLLLLSSPDEPKKTALLPETHIAVVSASRMVATMEDAFALLRRERGEPRTRRAAARDLVRLGRLADRRHRADARHRRARALSGPRDPPAVIGGQNTYSLAFHANKCSDPLLRHPAGRRLESAAMHTPVMLGPIPVDFILFALTLAGVAIFHKRTLEVALGGLAVILAYKLLFTGFKAGAGLAGLGAHFAHEWVILANLLLLLLGFALLSNHFEESHVPLELPRILPDDWKGGFVLLWIVFVLSSFLDNIAAAIIGGTMARAVFRGKVHIGYLAAVVAASNAGGSGSVVGDTTTTMMWIDGVSPLQVLDAYVAAFAATAFFAFFAAKQQHALSPISRDAPAGVRLDWTRVAIVAFILGAAISANVVANLRFNHVLDVFPVIGVAVWVALLVTAPIRQPDWKLLPGAFRGSIFLLALVTAASVMPVEQLPAASWTTTFGLGFLSSVFDNIPLTALALKQGGYDWGMLAFAVGFGGSMIWFGSSAGVAISNSFPEARSVGAWVKNGWHVAVGYILGFFVMLAVVGWHPQSKRERGAEAPAAVQHASSPTASVR